MPLILEGVVTTRNPGGDANIAPMGPIVTPEMTTLTLRPFPTSTTAANLSRDGAGVFHVVDDVLLLARASIGQLEPNPATFPATHIPGFVLADACRWYEFEVTSIDDSHERLVIETRVVHTGRLKDVFGFNRAQHAVLEAAILATRKHLLPAEEIERELDRLRIPVEKTAGDREREAFELLVCYCRE